MLHRLCGPPSIPLSFSLAAVVPRRRTYRVGLDTPGVGPDMPGSHSLRRGLPGYLILFATHAFVPQRQLKPSRPPSPLVFLLISTHFTATLGIPLSSPALKKSSFNPLTGLSPALLRLTYFPTCAPFTPNNSGQRSPPTYYRGCWHVVSRGFLPRYRQISSRETVLYDPKAFITHAALLGHAFAHCPRFSTAASRRSLGSVSVPVWVTILSDHLPVAALVGRHPAN